MQQTLASDVTFLRTARRLDTIVPYVDRRRHIEYLFVRKEHKIDDDLTKLPKE